MKKPAKILIRSAALLFGSMPASLHADTLIDQNFQNSMYVSGSTATACAGWTWMGTGKTRTSTASADVPCHNQPAINNQVIQFECISQAIHKDVPCNWGIWDVFVLTHPTRELGKRGFDPAYSVSLTKTQPPYRSNGQPTEASFHEI